MSGSGDMDAGLAELIEPLRREVEEALERESGRWQGPAELIAAMRHALLGGGKRIRPVLTLAACEAVGGDRSLALGAACALELIHTYSLVHDDLPAMDDDSVRRGLPTVHVAFGEALAILAGDALQAEAFACLVARGRDGRELAAVSKARCVEILARSAGAGGMVGGQARDVGGGAQTREGLERLHGEKTGALFVAAARMGAICGGALGEEEERLARWGACVGRAFQVSDDLIDALELKAKPGAHEAEVNLAAILGTDAAVEAVERDVAEAEVACAALPGTTSVLRGVAQWIGRRARLARDASRS